MHKKFLAGLVLSLLLAGGCRKDDKILSVLQVGAYRDTARPVPVDTGSHQPVDTLHPTPAKLIIRFKAMVNGLPLQPNTKKYHNSSEDTFTVSKFNHYVSKLRLLRNDGSFYEEPESYHLMKHVEGVNSFTLSNLPDGDFTGLQFLIGVDSLRNVSGIQSGDLDVSHGMFWDWNTGYIFFKLEGDYRSQNVPGGAQYAIHIGGFSGKFNCLQTASVQLSGAVQARKNRTSLLEINVLVDEIFQNPKPIGMDYYYENISGSLFQEVSVNYRDMFVFGKVEN